MQTIKPMQVLELKYQEQLTIPRKKQMLTLLFHQTIQQVQDHTQNQD